tara:strand:+ start:1483 stop:1989 length:507 start_codon:yes stop_codon:yes gene_type:complete
MALKYRTRRWLKSEDLNAMGSLFGGRLLEWIDEEAFIFAYCQLGSTNVVTKYISEIEFKSSARLGDVIEFGTDIVKFGKTSITLKIHVRNKRNKKTIVTVDKIVFVALDASGKPVRHNINKFSPEGRWIEKDTVAGSWIEEKPLDLSIEENIEAYEEEIELYKTYGGG